MGVTQGTSETTIDALGDSSISGMGCVLWPLPWSVPLSWLQVAHATEIECGIGIEWVKGTEPGVIITRPIPYWACTQNHKLAPHIAT